jgi:hypothetical protein
MHPLFGLSSLLLVVLGGWFILWVLRHLHDWPWRRDLQLTVLAAPLISLGLGVGGLYHLSGQICFITAPPWDYTLGMAVPVSMALVAAGGLGLGLVRHCFMAWRVARRGLPARPEHQALADLLAEQLGAPRCSLLFYISDRPLALTYGLFKPRVLLSTWMVEHLDQRELEAVLAHELAHAARRDYLVMWLTTVLRDSFFYLPTSWVAYRQLQREKEIACDDLAAGVTSRPLALASALCKVWHQATGGINLATAQPLVGIGECIEKRIVRLLRAPSIAVGRSRSRRIALGIGGSGLAGLLALEALSIAAILAPMGCGPVATFLKIV